MSRRAAVVALAVVAVVAGLWARSYFSPGSAARRQLRSMVRAIEDERLLAVMSGVSRAYSDHLGLDYETLGGLLGETMSTYDDLDVDLIITATDAEDTEVRIEVQFILWGTADGMRGYIVGRLSDPCTATVVWRKETPGWRLATTLRLDIPELRDELESRGRR
jgi:hypothetical protein